MTVANNDDSTALDLKYRPRNLDEVVGHKEAVQLLKGAVASNKIPNAVIFLGPTSAGKTTLAQAFAASVCGLETIAQQQDFMSVNAGDNRTIDDVRNLARLARNRPMRLKRRFIQLDEVQAFLSNPAAATAFLQPLENPSSTTTWLLTSMEPERFASNVNGKAILGRCTQVKLSPPSIEDLFKQGVKIVKGENVASSFSKETMLKIAESSQQQMRVLAKILQSVIGWNEGRGGGKITPDEVEKLLVTIDANVDDIDDLAWPWLYACYVGNAPAAIRVLLDVDNGSVFQFLLRAQLISRVILLDAAVKGNKHPKVWHNKASNALKSYIDEKGSKHLSSPLLKIRAYMTTHDLITATRETTFTQDALIGLTNRIINANAAAQTPISNV